jgi:type VI secretion system secreted protein VgrG
MNERVNSIGQSAISAIENPSPALFLHSAIFLRGNRIVSDETFRLVNFQGQESTSEPFDYQLELHGNTSPLHGAPFKFDDLIGRPVTVGIQYPSDYTQDEMSDRFQRAVRGGSTGQELSLFNGIVTSFTMEIPGVYRISMKPALWKLALTNRYMIHHQMNVRDAIASILDTHRIAYSMDAVSGDENPAVARIQDWLQAGEADLDFVRRLMGKAHLYYYFTHTGNGHKIVFANRPAYANVYASGQSLRYTYTGTDETGLAQSDVISQYSYQRSLTSSAVCGVFTRQEAAWEADPVAQFQSFHADSRPDLGELPFNQYKIYQYGCSNDEVRHFTDRTTEAMESSGSVFSGSSFCAHFRVGHQFSVTGKLSDDMHPSSVQPSLEGQRFVLTQVKHQATAEGGYQNEFQSTESSGFIAAYSIQETQQGTVLARVVSLGGANPPSDWRFYQPTVFDPETNAIVDTQGTEQKLNAMGVYVQFSTDEKDDPPVWVKLAPHMQTVPEIGVTVIVTRAQDESELPEIQSIIQSNGSMVIMPSKWTANSHVGSSYSTNYGDGQSIRFGTKSAPDLDTAVGIVTSHYDSKNYRDTSYSQGAGYSFSTADSCAGNPPNATELFGPYAGATDLLNASESFGSSYSRQYAQVTSNFSNIGTSYGKSKIGKSENYSTTTGTSYSETTHGGNITSITTINADSSNTSKQTGKSTTSNTITGNTDNTNVNTGSITSHTTVNGDTTNTSTNNGDVTATNTITGVNSTTTKIGVSNSNDATGLSNRNNVVGLTNSNSLTGVSVNVSATGASSENSATGATMQMSAVGASLSISARGTATDTTYTGNANSVSLTGLSTRVDVSGPGSTLNSKPVESEMDMKGMSINMLTAIKLIM